MEFGGGFFQTSLEGSVDLIICRDYIVNRRFFIYCSLACSRFPLSWLGNHLDRSILTFSVEITQTFALLSPFLHYSGANEVDRASVSVFKPTTDFEQTTHFDQLFAVLSV